MSFRAKLILAMMAVVGAATGLALLATQVQVAAVHRHALERQFEAQLRGFFGVQQVRLGAVRARCLGLARSVRLLAALEEEDAAGVYRIALDELRDVLGPPRADTAVFFRFLDAAGRLLPTDEEAAGRAAPALDAMLARLGGGKGNEQEVGYLATGAGDVLEVVSTRIVDPVSGSVAGVLVLGFAFAEPEVPLGAGEQAIRSALVIDGAVYGRLPAAARRALADVLPAAAAGRRPTLLLDGVPNLVLTRALNPGSAFAPAVEVGLYSLAAARREQRRLRLLVLAGGAAALAVGLVLSFLLAHGLTVPVRDLVRGVHEVEHGHYQHRVSVRGRDELAGLAAAFNEMAAGLALKDRYRHVLDVVTDPKVADELLAGSIVLGGETREAAVLFCDVRGFSALTERMEPAEVITLLNDHMSAMTAVVHAHHGVVDKFVGDLVMAVFGAPRAYGTEAEDAARCALAMLEERARRNAHAAHPLEVGIGMTVGRVVAGCMGSRERLNYTVLGERVNLASRLCDVAGPGEAVLDESMRACLPAAAQLEALPPLEVKGFSAPVHAYRLRALGRSAA